MDDDDGCVEGRSGAVDRDWSVSSGIGPVGLWVVVFVAAGRVGLVWDGFGPVGI